MISICLSICRFADLPIFRSFDLSDFQNTDISSLTITGMSNDIPVFISYLIFLFNLKRCTRSLFLKLEPSGLLTELADFFKEFFADRRRLLAAGGIRLNDFRDLSNTVRYLLNSL